jgi:pyruvate/2-oxoglutarate dehydrogenase complex dihydrolipoamide acyltransferase (E2) component
MGQASSRVQQQQLLLLLRGWSSSRGQQLLLLGQASSRGQQQHSPLALSKTVRGSGAHVAGFKHCSDFLTMHQANLLCIQLNIPQVFPLLDSAALEESCSQLPADVPLHLSAKPSTPPPGMEEATEYLAGFADFDETLLDEEADPAATRSSAEAAVAAAAATDAPAAPASIEAAAEAAALKAAEVLSQTLAAQGISPKGKRSRASTAAAAAAAGAATAAAAAAAAATAASSEVQPASKRPRRLASHTTGGAHGRRCCWCCS